jgi:hypothetical protein
MREEVDHQVVLAVADILNMGCKFFPQKSSCVFPGWNAQENELRGGWPDWWCFGAGENFSPSLPSGNYLLSGMAYRGKS